MVCSAGINIATIAGGANSQLRDEKNSGEQYAADNKAVTNQTTEKQRKRTHWRSSSAQGTPQNSETQNTPPTASTANHHRTSPHSAKADAQNGASAPIESGTDHKHKPVNTQHVIAAAVSGTVAATILTTKSSSSERKPQTTEQALLVGIAALFCGKRAIQKKPKPCASGRQCFKKL